MTFIERFTQQTEGLRHISSGAYIEGCKDCPPAYDDEDGRSDAVTYEDGVRYVAPYFSWSSCDTCGSPLGGDREVGHGVNADDVLVHLAVCTDCVIYLANGDLPKEEDDNAS